MAESMVKCTVLVSGLPKDITTETLETYFHSKERSNGGDVENVEVQLDTGCAELTFSSHIGMI